MLLRATRFGHLRRRILSWCRRTRISASSAARGRSSPIKAHQINLQRSLIDRTINRFASVSQLFWFGFAVGTRRARLRRGRLGDADRAGEDAKAVLTRLNAEVNAIVNTAEVKQQLVNLGVNPIGRRSLDELQAFVKTEVERWGKVLHEAGLAGSE
jgi:Tripartite tricarboxylate transporter family receptor